MKQTLLKRFVTGIAVVGLLVLITPAAEALDVKDLLDTDALKKEQAECMQRYRSCNGHWCAELKGDAKALKKCRSKCNKAYGSCLTRAGNDVIMDQLAKEVKKRKDQPVAQKMAKHAQKQLAKQRKGFKKCYSLTDDCDEKCYKLADKKFKKKYGGTYKYDKNKPEEHKFYYGVATKCRAKKRCYYRTLDCSEKVADRIPVIDSKMKKLAKKLK